MLTPDFYQVIDGELEALIQKYQADTYIQKHKSAKNNQKSYALLIWFLDFYARKSNYPDFITDGNNDSSCDIVFDGVDKEGKQLFYVVQSKWNNEKNAHKPTSRDEILKALTEFNTILRGQKKNVNEKLRLKLEALDQHLKANGAVKFIFLSLAPYDGAADADIQAFKNHDDKISVEVIDINRMKTDYIDRNYKKIVPLNPLENYPNPEESPITLEIVQKSDNPGNFVKIEKPFEAYMVLLRPKTLFELFDKYGFALFYKNVRNPLLQSQFNEDIEKTALENPAYFWYYNNGITAITYRLPTIGSQAQSVELTGLQIINGAQTVYSIYRAYKNASPTKRIQMDEEALVTMRLLKSGGKDFDLNVTRFTNAQNPVNDRDFCANDDIQIALQNESYKTKFWYEKRRGEFREVPEGVRVVSNEEFAIAYLAYHLEQPIAVVNNFLKFRGSGKNLMFISHKEDKNGMYEIIFNKDTHFENMICAFYIIDIVEPSDNVYERIGFYPYLPLFKIGFEKYFRAKFTTSVNIDKQIIRMYENKQWRILKQVMTFINNFLAEKMGFGIVKSEKWIEEMDKIITDPFQYEKLKEELNEMTITVEDIENIVIPSEQK